jgi:hypothetical protein
MLRRHKLVLVTIVLPLQLLTQIICVSKAVLRWRLSRSTLHLVLLRLWAVLLALQAVAYLLVALFSSSHHSHLSMVNVQVVAALTCLVAVMHLQALVVMARVLVVMARRAMAHRVLVYSLLWLDMAVVGSMEQVFQVARAIRCQHLSHTVVKEERL